MIKYVCDRCGKEENEANIIKCEVKIADLKDYNNPYCSSFREYDLCAGCTAALRHCLNGDDMHQKEQRE